MNLKRGEVILVDFPYPSGAASKVRPALVVQIDGDNGRLMNSIVAQITGNVQRARERTQVLIDLNTADGQQSGLQNTSVVNCVNLVTLARDRALRRLGALSDILMEQVNDALKAALALP